MTKDTKTPKKKNFLKNIKLRIPRLHPAQQKIIDEAKRFNVLACGRRFGKTTLGIHCLIKMALQGRPVAWFAPNMRLLGDVWRELQVLLKPVIIKVSQQGYRLELKGGGSIEMWSLDSSDSGRGRAYALVVVDEAAFVPNLEEAWHQTIRPMLMDYQGEAWFLSTPKGMNYFKTLFGYGEDPSLKDWASWQMPSNENPRMPPEEFEAARRGPQLAFHQEWLGQFINGDGSVFRYVDDAATIAPGGKPEAGHSYVIGCDFGRSNDRTAYVVLDSTDRKVVDMICCNQEEYAMQRARLKGLADKWKPRQIIAEKNGIGGPIIEQLRREGLRVEAFTTSSSSKARAIEDLAVAFEQRGIHILQDQRLIGELVAYQAEQLAGGRTRYGAPSGGHDDCVMALAIAWTAVSSEGRLVYQIPDAEIVVPDFRIPDFWPRAYGLVVMGNTVAAVWVARDPQTDKLYIYDEYLAEGDPAFHTANIRDKGDWIPGFMDSAANGRDRADGEQLMWDYRARGLKLQAVDSSLESGISRVLQRMHSGLLKVLSSCEEYFHEKRLYRRDEESRIVEQDDSLQDALRCVVNNISLMRPKPVPTPYYPPKEHGGGPRSWMSL